MTMKPLYIGATLKDCGKTSVSLGLMQMLKAKGLDPGYCKPVGQHYVRYQEKNIDEDGVLFFRARLGEMIKTAGANVTPREVEVALEEQPGVSAAYVVGVAHPDRGQNVAAAIVPKRGAEPTSEGVGAALRKVLSAYKVPRHYFFYASEDLPFTDSGKIQKNVLADRLAARIAAGEGGGETSG